MLRLSGWICRDRSPCFKKAHAACDFSKSFPACDSNKRHPNGVHFQKPIRAAAKAGIPRLHGGRFRQMSTMLSKTMKALVHQILLHDIQQSLRFVV
jgi:hypothetical protein